jgi:hypothetical protein
LLFRSQLVESGQVGITVDLNRPNLVVISNNTALSLVTVPSTVTTPTINYTTILTKSGSTSSMNITNTLTINRFTSGGSVPDLQVILPASIIISGTSWNGLLNLPQVQPASSVTLPVEASKTNTATKVIEIGAGDTKLTFNQAVRILFAGEAAHRVGFQSGAGPFTEITGDCGGDTPVGEICKTTVGSDLVVWTNHFTTYATFSSVAVPAGAAVGAPVGAPAGGGGGGPTFVNGVPASTGGSTLYEVDYDVCTKNQATIIAGTSDDPHSLDVKIRSATNGLVMATLASDQPYKNQNKFVFTVPLVSRENSFVVYVQNYVTSISQIIITSGCTGKVVVSTGGAPTAPQHQ